MFTIVAAGHTAIYSGPNTMIEAKQTGEKHLQSTNCSPGGDIPCKCLAALQQHHFSPTFTTFHQTPKFCLDLP